jgi:hypothetical protein
MAPCKRFILRDERMQGTERGLRECEFPLPDQVQEMI